VRSDDVDEAALGAVREAARERGYVSLGSRRTTSVHEFYRYPARFSPSFAASVIAAFADPGDVVLDPFVGGGTTLVEARLAGRVGVGSDINQLATFVSLAKTAVHTSASLDKARHWLETKPQSLGLRRRASWDPTWQTNGYLRHLDMSDTWRIRHVLAQALESLGAVDDSRAQLLIRCAILRTGQWALDMREEIPTVELFRTKLATALGQMIEVAAEYTSSARAADRAVRSGGLLRTLVLDQGLPGLADYTGLAAYPAPALICTSPPYPGVYVNYHRWKVRGRKETAAPYWVAGCLDGHGMAHYTMAAKVSPNLGAYFGRLTLAWSDLARIADSSTWVVQVVGFHHPESDLPQYLAAMDASGFVERRFEVLATASDGRLWRDVPGRRWWVAAAAKDGTAPHTAREVVLVHQLARRRV